MKLPFFLLATLTSFLNAAPAVKLQAIISSGIENPLFVAFEPGTNDRMYVMEQKGQIVVYDKDRKRQSVFLNIEDKVTSGGEMGLLGMAFHPEFEKNRRFFINYTAETPNLKTIVSEIKADTRVERQLLSFDQPYSNHNGGHIAFGPDHQLYITTGDGGSAGDPHGNSQNKKTLLGKMLRIDVNGELPYAIPKDNPLTATEGRREIFAWGLRNVWRFSFDKETGALFGGDVGQDKWEEVDLIEKGKNYGWNTMEGNHCFRPSTNCNQNGLALPLVEYPHSQGISVTGGYVYRGSLIKELRGAYVYGDYGSGKIWALTYDQENKKVVKNELLLNSRLAISSFAEDNDGELYVIHYPGVIYKLVSAR